MVFQVKCWTILNSQWFCMHMKWQILIQALSTYLPMVVYKLLDSRLGIVNKMVQIYFNDYKRVCPSMCKFSWLLTWGQFLVRLPPSKSHRDSSFKCCHLLMSNFLASILCKKVWRTVNRSTITVEKLTSGVDFSILKLSNLPFPAFCRAKVGPTPGCANGKIG